MSLHLIIDYLKRSLTLGEFFYHMIFKSLKTKAVEKEGDNDENFTDG